MYKLHVINQCVMIMGINDQGTITALTGNKIAMYSKVN